MLVKQVMSSLLVVVVLRVLDKLFLRDFIERLVWNIKGRVDYYGGITYG